MGTRPRRTVFLISGCLISEPALCTVISNSPPVAVFTSSANSMMLTV